MLSSQTIPPQIDTMSVELPTPDAKMGWWAYLLQDYLDGNIDREEFSRLFVATQ